MTRRRNTINIYDYPEHLNPFREDADDNSDRSNTTGQRRSSFRVNAWAMFSPSKGKSKTSDDINNHNHSTTSRFMTWTPKLLRRSFRRSSPSSRSSSPWDSSSPNNSQLSFRSSNSRTSLPPSGNSRTSFQSNSSRSMLPPSSSSPVHTLPSRRPTSPPSRPAPPIRPPLSPSRPLTPPIVPSTENCNSSNTETTPVPPRRRALYTAASPGKAAGELPSEDEVKYLQQGAKPKKKRRAPLPPQQPSPSKSPEDSRQVNPNESDVSVTPSITSSSPEEPTSQEQSSKVTTDLEETNQPEPQKDQEQSNADELQEKDKSPEVEDKGVSEDYITEKRLQNGVSEESSATEDIVPGPQELTINGENRTVENETQEDEGNRETEAAKEENTTEETETSIIKSQASSNSDEHLKVNFDVVLHISEEDLRDKAEETQNGGHNHSKNDENHNVKHVQENETMNSDVNGKNITEEITVKLHNGDSHLSENGVLRSEMNNEIVKTTSNKKPEPKPRTILSTLND